MVSVAGQLVPCSLDVSPVVSAEAVVTGDGNDLEIHELREQLRSLTLRRATIQKRICANRNALAALINLFGAGILNSRQCQAAETTGLFAPPSDKTGLCRAVMQQSPRWISLPEIIDQLRAKSPLLLAQFKNPGASVSNLLRMLQRRGEVELRSQKGHREWKWIGAVNGTSDHECLSMSSFIPAR